MVDITAKLIWYKLGERTGKMADAASAWYDGFGDHILDTLLVSWIGLAVILGFGCKFWVAAFGPMIRKPAAKPTEEGALAPVPEGALESCLWLNATLNWFYLHLHFIPEFLDAWTDALNDQAKKLGGPVQVKFEAVSSGTLPPKMGEVYTEPGPKDTFIIRCLVESRDLSFRIFTSQQTPGSVKLTNCTGTVERLRGTLKIVLSQRNGDIEIWVAFDGRPDIKVNVKPINTTQDADELVDLGVVEEVIRNSICMSNTKVLLSHWTAGTGQRQRPSFEPTEFSQSAVSKTQ